MKTKTNKVIVTGASGQDGSYMCEYLLKNTEHIVLAAIRRTSQIIDKNIKHLIDNPRFKIVDLDLNDSHAINSLIRDEAPDYFINFGACAFVPDSWKQPDLTLRVNAGAVIHILEAIKEYVPMCRFYNAGTSEEFGDVSYSPQDEKHPAKARSIYGASKISARQIIKVYRESYGIYAVQGWLFNHESPRRQEYYVTRKITKNVVRIASELVNSGKAPTPLVLGNMSARRDWSDAEDFVDGVWRMLNQDIYNPAIKEAMAKKGLGGSILLPFAMEMKNHKTLAACVKEYILSSNETHLVAEFVYKAFEAVGIEVQLILNGSDWKNAKFVIANTAIPVVVTSQEFYRPAEVELLHGDSTLARTELGWSPKTSFSDLVAKMIEADNKIV